MTVSHLDLEKEQERLSKVVSEIRRQLQEAKAAAGEQMAEAIEYRRSVWEEETRYLQDEDDAMEAGQYNQEMTRAQAVWNASSHNIKRLAKSAASAYFGRIDFREAGFSAPEEVYIGIQGVIDKKNRSSLVYDWRAPVSSLFYDYELGPARYECPAGEIRGDVLKKRQYKVAGDKLLYMFESDIKIDDDILQEVLSKNVDDKMRNIVATIQKEQNRAIRDEGHGLLMVSGPAGSGKTSIALHRVAYLLYSNRNTINSENIIVFSPNRVFSDYISHVLPELGEENMLQSTFIEYAERALGSGVVIEDMNDQMEYLLTAQGDPDYASRVKAIRYKASPGFLAVLKNYVERLKVMSVSSTDLVYNGSIIMGKEYIAKLYTQDYSFLPIGRRLDKLHRRFLQLLRPYELARWAELTDEMKQKVKENQVDYLLPGERREKCHQQLIAEFQPVRDKAKSLFSIDFISIYGRLFDDKELFASLTGSGIPEDFEAIRQTTLAALGMSKVPYDDVAPLLFLKGAVQGVPSLYTINYVVIDEVQDYSPIHFEVLKQLFPGRRYTVLGDFNQSIHPYLHLTDYDKVAEYLGISNALDIRLKKAYRSTREIAAFANGILASSTSDIEVVDRSGPKPAMTKVEEGRLAQAIASDVENLLETQINSIGIICKTEQESKSLYEALKDRLSISLLTRDDDRFRTGVVILPSYLSKGLEFDAILIPDAGAGCYNREIERRLLYTVCTRALHKLHLYYMDELSPLLAALDSSLYSSGSHNLAGRYWQ